MSFRQGSFGFRSLPQHDLFRTWGRRYGRAASGRKPNSKKSHLLLKRGINGVYHHVSEAHLHRYLAEFDFRFNNRSAVGVEDTERANRAIKDAAGKRLMYQEPRKASHA